MHGLAVMGVLFISLRSLHLVEISSAAFCTEEPFTTIHGPPHLPDYDDVDAPIHQPTYDTLIAAGIDDVLAHHIAHLVRLLFQPDLHCLQDETPNENERCSLTVPFLF
eukprot:SAG31_NODE_955_length_10799_cov_6.576636_13_plen_108_part_00